MILEETELLKLQERADGLRLLDKSLTQLAEAVNGLSGSQWTYQPSPDRWSIAGVVEHVALIDNIVSGYLAQFGREKAADPSRDVKQIDAMVLERVADRSTRVTAPPPLEPANRWTPEGSLNECRNAISDIRDILQTSEELRNHVRNHPILGDLDGYQWVLAVAGHQLRHVQQIQEVKAHPNYPTH